MARASNVVLICEDDAHAFFARGFISVHSYPMPRVSVVKPKAAVGDAKAFVLSQIPVELRRIRSSDLKSLQLLVLLDADEITQEERLGSVHAVSGKVEFLTVVVPTPEVEHWICELDGLPMPTNVGRKREAGKKAFKIGRECAKRCLEGAQLPTTMLPFCAAVRKFVENLR